MSINMEFNADRDFENWLHHLQVKYGEDFEILNGLHTSQLDFSSFINEFIDHDVVADATIDSSANASMKDICSFKAEQTKSQNKLFAFHKIFYELHKYYDLQTARDWLENEWNGSLYLHNSSTSSFFGYCFAHDISRLAREGLYFIPNFNNKPAKHLTTFIDHLMEFVSYYSNRSSGAVGIPSLLIWTWWFWKRDCETGYVEKDPDYYLRQNFQRLIYRINQCWIRINQPSFTNVSIYDRQYLEGVFGGMEYPDGTYVIDHIEDIIEHQKIFMDVVAEIRHHQMFTFPVISTMLMYKDSKFQDEEFAKWSCKRNMEWNDSNFFISSDIGILSSCCRMLSDTKGLNSFINSIGGTAISVGSIQVNTINLMRIAYECNGNREKFFEILKEKTLLTLKSLSVIRHIIKRNIDKGLLPNFGEGGVEMDRCYSTLGLQALFESVEHMGLTTEDEFNNVYYTEEGLEFADKIFDTINEVKSEFVKTLKETFKEDPTFDVNYSHNIEQVPAERAGVIFAAKDNLLYNKRSSTFIYSNQWYPLWKKTTLQSKLEVSARLDKQCNGGSVVHINIDSEFPNFEMAWDTLNRIARSGVYYFAYNSRINECPEHHAFVGSKTCPECGGEVIDTWQRVVGFLTPTRSYSKERFKEFNSRYWYNIAKEKLDF